MGSGTRRFEIGAFGLAVALLALVGFLSYRSAATMVDSASSVDHTHRVIEELDALLASVVDAETGRRGFALTNDEALLNPYRDAATRAAAHSAALRQLLSDNPDQVRKRDAVDALVSKRLAALDQAILAQRARGTEHFRDDADTLAGKDDMQRIRASIAEMVAVERSLLAQREARTRETVTSSRNVQLASDAFGVGLLVLVVVRLRRATGERNKSEERTRQNEEDLAITLQSIGDGVITTDSEKRVTRMNPAAESITGWNLADAEGKLVSDVFQLVHEVTNKPVTNPVERALEKETVVDIDDAALLVAKDGTKRRVADSAAPIRSREGQMRGAVLVFRDITKTLEDARSLRRVNAFLDTVIENIPDMIFVKDASDLAFVRFNRAGEKLLGLTRDELMGKTDFAFFPPDQAKAFVDKDRETLRGKVVLDIPEEPLTTGTGVRWLHTKKVPIIGDEGEPEYLLGISADITEQRRASLLLRASRDATEAAHRDLEAFSYSVAHDLRTPLRAIDGFSQALLDDYADRLDDQGKDYLGRVRNSARRMAGLIDDLLALARVSRTELERATIDLTALARQAGEAARKLHNERAELVVQEGLTVDADPRLVPVLLENLLANAFKFSGRKEDARVEVGMKRDGDTDVFFVKDNGAGFDLSAANKLFTAFQRYHRPTEFEGTGIGLATAERIVSRHGGRIWAEAAPGKGATFHFILERGDQAK